MIATFANQKRVASFRMIQKLFAYLEGKTYLISLSIAICFLENCSIKVHFRKRAEKRAEWHSGALAALDGCEIVFVDPDNGLMVPSARRSKKANKYVLPEELFDYYQQGASVIYYQHKARRQDGFYTDQHNKLLRDERIQGAEGLGLKFIRTSLRYYWFLLRPEHAETVRQSVASLLAGPWGDCFELR